MRNEEQNPVWKKYSHLLGEEAGYPAKWVDIFWNTDDDLRVKDVEVVFIPRGKLPDGPEGDRLWAAFASFNRQWGADLGNSVADWMEPDGHTPATIFGALLARGFTTQDEMVNALREFAHIRECEWARDMLSAVLRERGEGED